MTTAYSSAGASSSGAGASSSSPFHASPRSLHFFVRATDSKTIAIHAAWDDTVATILRHLASRGYGRDLHLLNAGRQLSPEDTIASLALPPDSTLHLAARLRSTPHPRAWQLYELTHHICSLVLSMWLRYLSMGMHQK
ncbi:hypothetical protein QYE76_006082 [Lolium multiflorum]|uniref:Ubiquitin-like domain-containing protein n=1 Tax=Lolium multiflorum TaxID=4521 RepID=A0AAD8RW21_LOLMU|nr:hypothetical protein QYE76_006082 [Lolium multiflorum]